MASMAAYDSQITVFAIQMKLSLGASHLAQVFRFCMIGFGMKGVTRAALTRAIIGGTQSGKEVRGLEG
jgi:hypothetical protein